MISRFLYNELKSLPRAVKGPELKVLVDHIERILSQLEARGEDVSHPLVEMTIESKFPEDVLYIIYDKSNSQHWNINSLREELRRISGVQESVNRIKNEASSDVRHDSLTGYRSSKQTLDTGDNMENITQTTRELHASAFHTQQRQPTNPCVF